MPEGKPPKQKMYASALTTDPSVLWRGALTVRVQEMLETLADAGAGEAASAAAMVCVATISGPRRGSQLVLSTVVTPRSARWWPGRADPTDDDWTATGRRLDRSHRRRPRRVP